MGTIHTTIIVEETHYTATKKPCLPTPPPPPPPRACHCLHIVPAPPLHSCTITTAVAPPPATFKVDVTAVATTTAPVMVTLANAAAPTQKILGLRYTDTGKIVPVVDGKGRYVPADTKGVIWIPSLKMWVGGPECEFK